MSKTMEYEPCYICGQETEEDNCKNCTNEITKLHTEFHTFQIDFDEVVIRLYRAQKKIEALELELETLGANAMKAMELKDKEIERLKTQPTAGQEKEAIVAWMRDIVKIYGSVEHGEEWPEDVVKSLCDDIERGEHWQMKENQND